MKDDDNHILLLEKGKRGLLQIIFGRTGITDCILGESGNLTIYGHNMNSGVLSTTAFFCSLVILLKVKKAYFNSLSIGL